MTETKRSKRLPFKSYLFKMLIAGVISSILNVILFYIGKSADAFPETIKVMGDNSLQVGNVIMMSVLAAVVGMLVFAAVGSLKIFRIIAAIVFILFIFTPFSVADASTSFIVFLEIMHVITAVVILWVASSKTALN